jgi:hypothetical protein
MARALEGLAAVATASGDAHLGARLFGAARALRASVGVTVWVPDHQSHDRTERALLRILSTDVFEERLRDGASLQVDQVPELLADLDTQSSGFANASEHTPVHDERHVAPIRSGWYPTPAPARRRVYSEPPTWRPVARR